MDPVNGFIELDLVKTFQDGWTIDPIREPLRVSRYNIIVFIIIHFNFYPVITAVINLYISTDQEERC